MNTTTATFHTGNYQLDHHPLFEHPNPNQPSQQPALQQQALLRLSPSQLLQLCPPERKPRQMMIMMIMMIMSFHTRLRVSDVYTSSEEEDIPGPVHTYGHYGCEWLRGPGIGEYI